MSLELLNQEGSATSGSLMLVDELFREAFERAGIDGQSITSGMVISAKITANFMLNSWSARGTFSWMRRRHFTNLIPGQFSYPLPLGTRSCETVVLSRGVSLWGDGSSVWANPDMLPQNFESVVNNALSGDPVVLSGAGDDPLQNEKSLGIMTPVPRAVSYVSVMPGVAGSVYSFALEYMLEPGGEWLVKVIVPAQVCEVEPLTWLVVQDPVYAYAWRIRFLEDETPPDKTVGVTPDIVIRHVFFLEMPSGIAQGLPADRALGEIGMDDWMNNPQKMQRGASPTSWLMDARKQSSLMIWPVPELKAADSGFSVTEPGSLARMAGVIPGLLYTSYRQPRDIEQLFQYFDVPAYFVDAMAAELAYRFVAKAKPDDQARVGLLKAESVEAFRAASAADAETTGVDLKVLPDFSGLKLGRH